MNAFTNYLEKLGSNFIVSAMVPSLAFVIASILLFDPILNIAEAFKDEKSIFGLVSFGVVVFIITVIIVFTLTALNTYILKVFEGYDIPFPFHVIYSLQRRYHFSKASRLAEQRDKLEKDIRNLEILARYEPGVNEKLEGMKDEYFKIASDYDMNYPADPNDVLPTRFGNTLKAAENYSGVRYGLDGVLFWPRLVHVIPLEYKMSIDSARNELSFLVNMSLLSGVFTFLCLTASLISIGMNSVVPGNLMVFLGSLGKALPYLTVLLISLASTIIFYRASLYSVSSFGLMIRSSFDLFRLDLLKKLGLRRPVDSVQEYNTWYTINELIALGDHSLTYEKLNYRRKE
jgi:ABC-type multidrug transport system fused ATPase/permease subunit